MRWGLLLLFLCCSATLGEDVGRKNDSLALIAILEANSVKHWDPYSPLDIWDGVSLEGGRVVKLLLPDLNVLPAEIGNLSYLESLKLGSVEEHFSISENVSKLERLKRLQIRSGDFKQPLQVFPIELCLLKNLEELDLSSSQFREYPHEFSLLKNLKNIDLSWNGIDQIPFGLGTFKQLRKINLSHNSLSILKSDIGMLENLLHLDISDNKLENVPKEIGRLSNLRFLDLSHNLLTDLPIEVGDLVNLSTLYLDKNDLGLFPLGICNLLELECLSLKNNTITILPDEIGNLEKLCNMDFRFNQIHFIPKSFMKTNPKKDSTYIWNGHNGDGHYEYFYTLDLWDNNIDVEALDSDLIKWLDENDPNWNGKKVQNIKENSEGGYSDVSLFQKGNLLSFSKKLSTHAILKIFTPNGRIVKSVPIHNNQCRIDGLTNGFYALQIIDENVSFSQSLMLK